MIGRYRKGISFMKRSSRIRHTWNILYRNRDAMTGDAGILEKMAYWDHSYHQLTLSTQFFIDLMMEKYEVIRFWDDSWQGGEAPSVEHINGMAPAAIVFCQLLPDPQSLKAIHCQNRIFIPMQDSIWGGERPWMNYRDANLKIISFSKKIHQLSRQNHYQSLYLQYFPRPLNDRILKTDQCSVFFWPRTNMITWDIVKKLLGKNKIDKVYFRIFPDPGFKVSDKNILNEKRIQMPSHEDIERYHIQFIQGWLEEKKYLEILRDCNIYFASRPLEGIGMSFLNAMALGLCVIAPDYPTANDYIISGFNGLLYDLDDPQPLNLTDVNQIGLDAQQYIKRGYEKWLRQRRKVLDYIKKQTPSWKWLIGLS
jgi:hypothetical protein